MRILLIVNSFATSVTARNTVVVQRRLARDHHVDLVETNRRGHATRFAFDAARRNVDVVVGFGGDGTLNEVATGIAGTDAALGVLPGGSTNVFARTIGLPNDPVAAVDLLADGIDAGDLRPIGLGRVNGRFFCFHTGIGFDAAVVAAVERRASLKRWLGHPLFITAALTTWLRGYDRADRSGGHRGRGSGKGRAKDSARRSRGQIVTLAKARILRAHSWIPAFAGLTGSLARQPRADLRPPVEHQEVPVAGQVARLRARDCALERAARRGRDHPVVLCVP